MYVKWKLVSVHFEIVLDLRKIGARFASNIPWDGNHFGHTRSYTYVTLAKRKVVSVRLEIVLISAQHRYTFVLNVPWAWKSLWAQPMVLLGIVSHMEALFSPFGRSVSLSAR